MMMRFGWATIKGSALNLLTAGKTMEMVLTKRALKDSLLEAEPISAPMAVLAGVDIGGPAQNWILTLLGCGPFTLKRTELDALRILK